MQSSSFIKDLEKINEKAISSITQYKQEGMKEKHN